MMVYENIILVLCGIIFGELLIIVFHLLYIFNKPESK